MRRRADSAALAALLLATAVSAACATSNALHRGESAEFRRDYDLAVVEFTKALRLDPDNGSAREGLERAKARATEEHLQKARRFAALGKFEEAVVEYGVAAELSPANTTVDEELRTTRNKLRAKVAVSRDGKTELQSLIDRTRDMAPPGLDLPQNIKMPGSLVFRDASSRDVFTAIARLGGISLVFDPQFRDTPVTLDLRNATLEDALNAVAGATRTFFRVTAPQTVIVVPDTAAKRREYEEEVVRTFYLSNADPKETMDMLRLVLDARRLSLLTATNAIVIKDTPEHIVAASHMLAAIDKAKPEVIIDVQLLEVDRTRLLEYGLQIASPNQPGINGSVTIAADANQTLTLQMLKNLSASDILLTNLPGLYYRLLKSDANTRILANPQLRASEGATASARFGDRVPVPVTTFTPIATGGTPQQPIVSYNYENIGVNIDITPRTHHDDDVTLLLNIAVTNISGSGFGGLPTFGNREIKTQIRLRDGETNLLAGLIRDDERRQVDGIPGLTDLPGVGRIFSNTTKNTQQTDIVLTLTPHIVRVLDLTEADLRPFRVSRDSTLSGGGNLELPVLPAVPPAPSATPSPAPPPTTQQPGAATPVLPPPAAPPTPR
jgi:general secretion pathway protein D